MVLPLALQALGCGKKSWNSNPGGDGGTRQCTGIFKIEDLNGNPAYQPDGREDYLWDQTKLRTFNLEVKAADWKWLTENVLQEKYVPATMVFDGKRYFGAAVRFKGAWANLLNCFDSSGNQICKKLSIKVRFNKYDPCGRFYGVRRLNFNAAYFEHSMMRERLAYNIIRNIGLKASRATHAQLQINGETPSLYVLIEQVDKEYLEDRFDNPEGNLYKEVWTDATEDWSYTEGLRTNEATADIGRYKAFGKAVRNSSDSNFAQNTAAYIDTEHLARYLAVERAIGGKDGFTHFWCWETNSCVNHNFYMYEEPGKKFHFIPWDMDTTFWAERDKAALSPDWWNDLSNCPGPVSVCELDPRPGCSSSSTVVMPQCDNLMRNAVKLNPAAYRDTMSKLKTALGDAPTMMEAWRSKIREAIRTDPLLSDEMTVDYWERRVDELKSRAADIVTVLNTL